MFNEKIMVFMRVGVNIVLIMVISDFNKSYSLECIIKLQSYGLLV